MQQILFSDLPVVTSADQLGSLKAVAFHDLYDYTPMPDPIKQRLTERYGAFWEGNRFFMPITLLDAPKVLVDQLQQGRRFDLLPGLPSLVILGYPLNEAIRIGRFLNAESLLDASGKLRTDVVLNDSKAYWVNKFLKSTPPSSPNHANLNH